MLELPCFALQTAQIFLYILNTFAIFMFIFTHLLAIHE